MASKNKRVTPRSGYRTKKTHNKHEEVTYEHKASSDHKKSSEYKSGSDDNKDSYSSSPATPKKPEYHHNIHDYPHRHLETCGVCRQGQCVAEIKEWCTDAKHASDSGSDTASVSDNNIDKAY